MKKEVDGNIYMYRYDSLCISMLSFRDIRPISRSLGGSLSVSIDRIVRHIYLFRTHPTMFFFHYPSRPRTSLLFRSISVIIISRKRNAVSNN